MNVVCMPWPYGQGIDCRITKFIICIKSEAEDSNCDVTDETEPRKGEYLSYQSKRII